MTINIPHPECPTCNPKCPCCGTPIKAAPKPAVNPDPMQPFGPWVQPTYPVPFNPYPQQWPWDGFHFTTTTEPVFLRYVGYNTAAGGSISS